MTNQGVASVPSSVCPSCNTRLRLPQLEAEESQFDCPECQTSLAIRRDGDGNTAVSIFEPPAAEEPSESLAGSRPAILRDARSRLIAAAVSTAGGIVIALLLIPTDKPVDRSGQHVTDAEHVPAPEVDPIPQQPASNVIRRDTANSGTTRPDLMNEPANTLPAIAARPDNRRPDTDSVTEQEIENTEKTVIADLSELPVKLSLPSASSRQADTRSAASGETARTTRLPGNDSKITTVSGTAGSNEPTKATLPSTTEKQPSPRPMTVQQRLEISIRRFRQTKPVALAEIIRTVEQMCRVQVDTSVLSSDQLNQEVSVSLQNTTPALILTEVGRKTGLRVIINGNSVQMLPVNN